MAFDDLSPESKQRVLGARAVYDFFQSEIAPRLAASADERQRFAAAPAQYLVSAGAPVLADLSADHRTAMDAVLAGPPPVGDTVQCWICTKAYEVLITTIIVIGVILVEAAVIALITAISGASLLVPAIVAFLIDEVGMTIGAEVLGPMVEHLAIEICKKTGGCS
jgi:hypothetical protein